MSNTPEMRSHLERATSSLQDALNWLAELRQTADYGEIRNVSMLDAEDAINIAERFLNQVHRLLGYDL